MMIIRPIQSLSAPLPKTADLSCPEAVILRVSLSESFDVGACCYKTRGAPGSGRTGNGIKAARLVDPGSLDPLRRQALRDIIVCCSNRLDIRAKRPRTVGTTLRTLIGFLDWADDERRPFPLTDAGTCRKALADHEDHLRERIRSGAISNNTAAIRQLALIDLAGELLQSDDIAHGLRRLRIEKQSRQGTPPPPSDAQGRVLGLCQCLFDGLSDLVLNVSPYPFRLAVPKSLGAAGDGMWLFPGVKWCMPPHELRQRETLKQGFWAFDYLNGRVAETDEIWHRYAYNPAKQTKTATADLSIRAAQQAIVAANGDSQNPHRRNAALLAHNAFIVLFLANTGMNWASAQQLEWDGEFAVGGDRQGFRTIKHRAAGRPISFEIQTSFMPAFRRFLGLRHHLLNGFSFPYLFLAGGNFTRKFYPLQDKTLTSIFDSLRRIDPDLPRIMSKQWRAGKSDWLIRNVDVSTAALVLQNSEQTVLRSYAEGSAADHAAEMTAFLTRLQDTVLAPGIAGGDEIAVGVCSSHGAPSPIGPAPVTPDCRGPEGCLFCDKLKVHADERDTRKLASCRYCLQQSAHMTLNDEHFQSLFGPLFKRIDEVLSEIDRRAPGLVARVSAEVEEGGLDPYWARKLELLIALDLVA